MGCMLLVWPTMSVHYTLHTLWMPPTQNDFWRRPPGGDQQIGSKDQILPYKFEAWEAKEPPETRIISKYHLKNYQEIKKVYLEVL